MPENTVGLLAYGRSANWELAVDETIGSEDRLFLQIEGPTVYMYVEMPSLDVISKIIVFLDESVDEATNMPTEVTIGEFDRCPVKLVSDAGSNNRCYVCVHSGKLLVVRIAIADSVLQELRGAARELMRELGSRVK